MIPSQYRSLFAASIFCISAPVFAQDEAEAAPSPNAEEQAAAAAAAEQTRLETANKIAAAKLAAEIADHTAEIARLKAEREAIAERIALLSIQTDEEIYEQTKALREENTRLALEVAVDKAKAEKATHLSKLEQVRREQELAELRHLEDLAKAEQERESFTGSEPVYLDNPLQEDGTLIISDRRIPLNGAITYRTANFITDRLAFFNNKDKEKPIFIVIDDSPGGSVMAGYRILKAMEASEAPVHVVVKSFAASMAACITTLAEHSYAYPNAIILHHQLSTTLFFARLNLTEQKELHEESQKWWVRLATPIADKMGVSMEEFIKMMYDNASSGDWAEFGERAQELKWVNTIVNSIVETSLTRDPDVAKQSRFNAEVLAEELDEDGKPVIYLPRPNPRDRYFLYNPDQYFRLR